VQSIWSIDPYGISARDLETITILTCNNVKEIQNEGSFLSVSVEKLLWLHIYRIALSPWFVFDGSWWLSVVVLDIDN